MSRTYLSDINLSGNKLLGARINPLSTAPTSDYSTGELYYNTSQQALAFATTTGWKTLIKDVASFSDGLTATTNTAGQVSLNGVPATASTQGMLTAAGFALLDGATDAATPSALALRDAAGNFKVGTPVNATDAVPKSYVDQLVSAGMRIVGGITPAADQLPASNVDFPAGTVGEAYVVQGYGYLGGVVEVESGDTLVCLTDTVSGGMEVYSSWLILQGNTTDATDVVHGIVRFATTAEVDANTAGNLVMSVNEVTRLIGALTTEFSANTHQASLAIGQRAWSVDHNLNGRVMVEVFDTASGQTVVVDVERTNDNTLRIDTASNIADALTVLVTYCDNAAKSTTPGTAILV
jgi:hypothetical protein